MATSLLCGPISVPRNVDHCLSLFVTLSGFVTSCQWVTSTQRSLCGLWSFNFIRRIMWLFLAFSELFSFYGTPVAYGSSWARGRIRAAVASLYHSHSNSTTEPHLQPMLQLVAMPDPSPGIKLASSKRIFWVPNLLSHSGNS